MATTNGNRKILDTKRWEFMAPAPVATVAGAFVVSSRHLHQRQMYIASATSQWLYLPEEDAWVALPSAALAGTFGAGACGTATAFGPTGTATGGTVRKINTGLTIARDMRGYKVMITAGTCAGEIKTISSNTIGANSIITVDSDFTAPIDATSVYRLLTPRFYILGSGLLAAGSFKVYDMALNTWTTMAHAGLPATLTTDSRLVATPSFIDTDFVSFSTGTASSATATTLVDSTKNWTDSQWINYQVRIVSGTGAGQIRTITANTSTGLTVAAWTINPDATSTYSIEGNGDFLYYMGTNAVTMYRYSISANTWSTITPGVARAGAPGFGMSGHWIWDVNDPAWTDEAVIQNGRYIYSLRGSASAVMDRYDIAANAWRVVAFAPAAETFTIGTKYVYNGNYLYIQKEATGRWLRYDFTTASMDGWSVMTYSQGVALLGDTAFDITYRDGATEIVWIHMVLNTSQVMLRQMII